MLTKVNSEAVPEAASRMSEGIAAQGFVGKSASPGWESTIWQAYKKQDFRCAAKVLSENHLKRLD